MVLFNAKSANYTLYQQWGAGGSGMWPHCSYEMSQMGMQILFKQLYINMVLERKKKSLPIFFPSLEKTLILWASYPDRRPCSWKPFASCGQPSYLLTDFCPLPLPTHNAVPFPSDFLICISTFTDFVNFHLHANPSRNHSWLGLQNLLNQKSQLYIFKNFLVWALVFLFRSLFLLHVGCGGMFCFSVLS